MMTYDEFKEKIRDEIKDVLPERYENSEVEIHTVNKNNQQLDGLTIGSPDGDPVVPTIYLNSFYESYQDGEYFSDILESIANIRTENEHKISLDVNSITDYEIAKDRILPIVVGAEKNAAMFADRPHRTMADLAVLYRVELGNDTRGTMSTPVTYRLLRQWNVSQDEIHKVAVENMERMNPSTFKTMTQTMEDMMKEGVEDNASRTSGLDVAEEEPMYVLTNVGKYNGAAALLDEKLMEQISEKFREGFYIIPSSIHETLIVPKSQPLTITYLENMVSEINATEVSPEEMLSNHIYEYDEENHEIIRAGKKRERETTRESIKTKLNAKKKEAHTELSGSKDLTAGRKTEPVM